MSALTVAFHIGLEALESTIRQEKEIKDMEIRKKERKLSLFLDDMIVYIEIHYPYIIYPSEKTLQELVSGISKTTGHKMNTQKSSTFLATKTGYAETEIKNTAPFIIAAKKLKHLDRHLTKHGQDLYGENYKMLQQKSKM